MKLLGVTKGTEFESQIDQMWKGEAQGAAMYYGLAYVAKEKGFLDLAQALKAIANDEAGHAGLYGVLNGHVNEDIFPVLSNLAQLESGGEEKINELAKAVRAIGLDNAAEAIEAAAIDEAGHGKILKELVDKYLKK